MLKKLLLTLVALSTVGLLRAAEIRVVVSPQASAVERAATGELVEYLARIYPQDQFVPAEQLPPSGRAILVGSLPSDTRLRDLLTTKPTESESYVVAAARDGQLGIIAGADPRGVVYGVYALLEKLGCGFYLSSDALPPPRREGFSFNGWQLADRPLVADRLVFNWHNFLSGCSTWNLPEWKSWIGASSHRVKRAPQERLPSGWICSRAAAVKANARSWSTLSCCPATVLWRFV